MKLIKILTILFGVIFVLANCGDPNDPVQIKHKEVMEIHDDVMPKQSALSSAQRTMNKWIASKDQGFTPELDFMDNLKSLAVAEEEMWEWMNQYKKPKGEDVEANLNYLEDQKIKISKVRDQMLTSLENYEKIKEKYGF